MSLKHPASELCKNTVSQCRSLHMVSQSKALGVAGQERTSARPPNFGRQLKHGSFKMYNSHLSHMQCCCCERVGFICRKLVFVLILLYSSDMRVPLQSQSRPSYPSPPESLSCSEPGLPSIPIADHNADDAQFEMVSRVEPNPLHTTTSLPRQVSRQPQHTPRAHAPRPSPPYPYRIGCC